MVWAEKKIVEAWLAQRASAWKNRYLSEYLEFDESDEPSEAIMACNDISGSNYGVQIGDVRPIAKAIEVELNHTRSTSDTYPEELSFEYAGVKFFSIYSEEELING